MSMRVSYDSDDFKENDSDTFLESDENSVKSDELGDHENNTASPGKLELLKCAKHRLNEEMNSLLEENKALKERSREDEATMNDLESKVQDIRKSLRRTKKEKANLERRVGYLKYKDEIDQLNRKIEKDANNFQKETNRLENEGKLLKLLVHDLQSSVYEKTIKSEKLSSTLQTYKKENEDLKERLREHERHIQNINEEKEELEFENTGLRKKIRNLHTEYRKHCDSLMRIENIFNKSETRFAQEEIKNKKNMDTRIDDLDIIEFERTETQTGNITNEDKKENYDGNDICSDSDVEDGLSLLDTDRKHENKRVISGENKKDEEKYNSNDDHNCRAIDADADSDASSELDDEEISEKSLVYKKNVNANRNRKTISSKTSTYNISCNNVVFNNKSASTLAKDSSVQMGQTTRLPICSPGYTSRPQIENDSHHNRL